MNFGLPVNPDFQSAHPIIWTLRLVNWIFLIISIMWSLYSKPRCDEAIQVDIDHNGRIVAVRSYCEDDKSIFSQWLSFLFFAGILHLFTNDPEGMKIPIYNNFESTERRLLQFALLP
jgi:hypothetical protein